MVRVWFVVYWERKFSKVLVFEIDFFLLVESIILFKVKFVLRIFGYLFFGVVRIYFRKIKYLLVDCIEVFVKIKMVFRLGVVDLFEEGRELVFVVVIMLEVFIDFDMILFEFK